MMDALLHPTLPFQWYGLWAITTPLCLTFIPPKPYRAYVSCSILFSILIKAQLFYEIDPSKENASIALIFQGVLFGLFFYTFNLFFLVEYPEFTDYRIGIETLDDVRSLKQGTWKKFKWAVARTSISTITGHGWNWQIRGSKAVGKEKKEWLKSFIIHDLIIKYTIFDILFHLYLSTDYIKYDAWGPNNVNDLIFMHPQSQLSPIKQLLLTVGSLYCVYFGIEMMYKIVVFINVYLLGTYELHDYPEIFGSFNGAYTVKSLWGNVWHKLMYQLAVPQSQYLAGRDFKAKHLGKAPRFGNEMWNKYLMYLLVFVFTGIFHATATLNMPWNVGAGYNINAPFAEHLPRFMSRCFYSFFFFPCQFMLILVETFVIKCYKKYIGVRLPQGAVKVIGIAWIGLSEMYLLELYIDEMAKSGFKIRELVVPNTPVHLLYEHYIEGR